MRFNQQRNRLVGKLLVWGSSKLRFWVALSVLFIGLSLFMLSVLAWSNFHQMLYGNNNNDNSGSTFLTISKKYESDLIKNKILVFSGRETEELRYAPEVQGVEELTANSFTLKLQLGNNVLTTPLTVETVNTSFIDNPPVDWYWEPTSPSVPIIVPRDLQSLYNFNFASSRNLFPMSDPMVKNLALKLIVGDSNTVQKVYNASIVGFTDRVASILVPDSFMVINERIFGKQPMAPTRLLVKVKDPSANSFIDYLQRNHYITNTEQLHWNKARIISGWANKALLIMAALMLGSCIMAFLLFAKLTLFRARSSIGQLLQLGYDTSYLFRYILLRYTGLLLFVSLPVIVMLVFIQSGISKIARSMMMLLSANPDWKIWLVLAGGICILFVLLLAIVMKLIKYPKYGSND